VSMWGFDQAHPSNIYIDVHSCIDCHKSSQFDILEFGASLN
jgi:hypothetical protein